MAKLIAAYTAVDEKRYRESPGLDYEDFEEGDIFEHRPGRTITDIDNIWQSLIDMNKHPIHIDGFYASKTQYKKLLVSSSITLSVISGMSASLSARAIANLGWDMIKLPHPVFAGDTIYAESKVIFKRESKSRSNQGIVTIHVTGINQEKKIVISFNRSFLVPKKGHSVPYNID